MIDRISSTTAFRGDHFLLAVCNSSKNQKYIFFPKTIVLLQIGTTAPSWSQWTRQFRRRSHWRALDQAQDTILRQAQEVTRTLGEGRVQGEDTVPKRATSDFSIRWSSADPSYSQTRYDQCSQHCRTQSLLNPKPTLKNSNDSSPFHKVGWFGKFGVSFEVKSWFCKTLTGV